MATLLPAQHDNRIAQQSNWPSAYDKQVNGIVLLLGAGGSPILYIKAVG